MRALLTRNRRAVLDGLARILDAGGLEDLFAGPDDEAAMLYDLLIEVARGRSASCYWEVCRTARRRGVTPEYVSDRATVLLSAITERRRTDLYRLLGVPPLSSGEMLRQRWLEFAKRAHPDVGGDATVFRRVKEAYEVLRDPERRAEYERFWLQALGPFERIAPAEDREYLEAARITIAPREPRLVEVREEEPAPEPVAPEPPVAEGPRAALHAAARLLARGAVRGLGLAPEAARGLSARLAQLEQAMASVTTDHLESFRAEVERGIAACEAYREQLGRVGALKRQLVV
ncbi:MAG: J domain-containing protein [Candidatus Binatia bacterium]